MAAKDKFHDIVNLLPSALCLEGRSPLKLVVYDPIEGVIRQWIKSMDKVTKYHQIICNFLTQQGK